MNIEELEKEVWDEDGETAIRIVERFDWLIKFRAAADTDSPNDLIAELKRIDPGTLDRDFNALVDLFFTRFESKRAELIQLKRLPEARRAASTKTRKKGSDTKNYVRQKFYDLQRFKLDKDKLLDRIASENPKKALNPKYVRHLLRQMKLI